VVITTTTQIKVNDVDQTESPKEIEDGKTTILLMMTLHLVVDQIQEGVAVMATVVTVAVAAVFTLHLNTTVATNLTMEEDVGTTMIDVVAATTVIHATVVTIGIVTTEKEAIIQTAKIDTGATDPTDPTGTETTGGVIAATEIDIEIAEIVGEAENETTMTDEEAAEVLDGKMTNGKNRQARCSWHTLFRTFKRRV